MIKNLHANKGDTRDVGLIPGTGRSPGEGNGNLLQYSCLGNPKGRGAWPAIYSTQSRKESNTTEHAHLHASIS